MAVRCPFFDRLKEDQTGLETYINEQLKDVIGFNSKRPSVPTNIVLYGFGRVGRLIARMLVQSTGPGNYFRLSAIVIRKASDGDIYKRASLLQRDSVHGSLNGTVRVDDASSSLVRNGNPVKIIYAGGPDDGVYADHDILKPIVIDNTGVWRDEAGLSKHIKSGAQKVILTAPAKGNIKNIVNGVNNNILEINDEIISAASCTTNAIVPVLDILNKEYGISGGHIETVHSYTNDQNLIDNFHKGDRRGRSAELNMVVTSTGAVKAVSKALPELDGKLTGNAIRVPIPNVSMAILNLTLGRDTSKREINEFLREIALHSKLQDQVSFTVAPDAVSSDFVGTREASIVDSLATVVNGNLEFLYLWYDNQTGTCCQGGRMVYKMAGVTYQTYPAEEFK